MNHRRIAPGVIILTSLLAVLAAPEPAPASDDDTKTSVDIQVRYRAEADRKEFDGDLGFDTFQLLRTRAGLTAKMGEGTKARLLVQDSRTLGVPASGTLARDVNLGIHEAFLYVEDFAVDDFALQAGRFEMKYGNERLVGSVGWDNNGRTFDGLRGSLRKKEWRFDLFWTKLTERNLNVNIDRDFLGLVAKGSKIGAEFFLLHDLDGDRTSTGEKRLKRWTAGAYSQRKFAEKLDYIANMAYQFGGLAVEDVGEVVSLDIAAYLLAVELGYTMPSGGAKYRIAGGVDWTSGDDDASDTDAKSFNNQFYTGHKFRGFMDLFLPSDSLGLIDLYLRQTLGLESGWTLLGDAHLFLTAEDYVVEDDAGGEIITNKNVGVEIDLTAKTPRIGRAAVQLGGSVFIPSEDFAGTDADPGFWGYAMVTVSG